MAYDVLIIGAGPAGISAALWCRRLGLSALLLEAEGAVGGQVPKILNPIEDYPGLSVADGPALAEHFARHLEEAAAPVRLQAPVTALDVAGLAVELAGGERLAARRLILATGARPRRLGVPGEAEMLARGEVYRGSRDAALFRHKPVVVAGGG